jgi:DNA-binding response OmpR family regulator
VDATPLSLALLKVELQPHGLAVWLASEADEALRLFRCRYLDIDLVVLDLDLPRLQGLDLLERFRQLNPEVAFCFLTTHAEHWTDDQRQRLGKGAVIRKPFVPATAAGVVREVLRQGAPVASTW